MNSSTQVSKQRKVFVSCSGCKLKWPARLHSYRPRFLGRQVKTCHDICTLVNTPTHRLYSARIEPSDYNQRYNYNCSGCKLKWPARLHSYRPRFLGRQVKTCHDICTPINTPTHRLYSARIEPSDYNQRRQQRLPPQVLNLSSFLLSFLPYGQRSKLCCPWVKFTLEQATKTQRGNRGIALLFLNP